MNENKNYLNIMCLACWIVVLICNLSLYSKGKAPTELTVILMNICLIIEQFTEAFK